MDNNSSGEDLIVKLRKPYTITKQREKWTEEEHNKFIEALKLYGRAWGRIEEHIGTKTAVQIRSHAQKFFTKLEKEALTKGIPFGQAHDIEIPPPRPKRKPTNPYPRKTGIDSLSSPVEGMDNETVKSPPLSLSKEATDMEKNAPGKIQETKDNSSEVFKGFIPFMEGAKGKIALEGSTVLNGDANKDSRGNETTNTDHVVKELRVISQTKSSENGTDVEVHPEKVYLPIMENQQGNQTVSKHGPMLKGSSDKNIQMTVTDQAGGHANKSSFQPSISSMSELHANSGISSIHQSFPAFPSFTQFPSSHGAYTSFLNISSTFSSLIMSTLLQNPAVYAAACLAASFWPSSRTDASLDSTSETLVGGTPAGHMNPSPSMAAIVSATVAAASAWWAIQGLLPVFSPLHAGFMFVPAHTTTINTVDTFQVPENRKEEKYETLQNSTGVDQQVEPEQYEARKPRYSSSKSSVPSSDSDESGQNDLKGTKTNELKPLVNDEFHDLDKARSKKKLNRSSCSSNTTLSSKVETDAREKLNEDNDEAKQACFSYLPSEVTNRRRVRSSGSMKELWKEVSEKDRIAFQALFTREVLPQSFSPPHPKDSTGYNGDTVRNCSLTSDNGRCKPNPRRTGFEPYKRCSMESKESRSPTGEEGANKRIRLDGETSI